SRASAREIPTGLSSGVMSSTDRRGQQCVLAVDADRDARRRVKGHPCDGSARGGRGSRGLPDPGREIRRLLAHDNRGVADEAAHRGAGSRRSCNARGLIAQGGYRGATAALSLPSRSARSTARASSTRDETPILRKMLRGWVSTVFWVRNSSEATPGFVLGSTTSRAT